MSIGEAAQRSPIKQLFRERVRDFQVRQQQHLEQIVEPRCGKNCVAGSGVELLHDRKIIILFLATVVDQPG